MSARIAKLILILGRFNHDAGEYVEVAAREDERHAGATTMHE
jgi:hypothetical protein